MRSVKPHTRTRSSPAKCASSRAFTPSWRPHSATTRPAPASSDASTAPSRSPTAQPPPETTASLGSAGRSRRRRASSRSTGTRKSGELRPRTATTSVLAGDPAHLLGRLGMRDQVEVDARVRPVAKRRQVGDRRHGGHPQASSPAQAAEHVGDARIGGHHHVGPLGLDQAHQSARADQIDKPAGYPAPGPEHRDEPELEVEEAVAPLGVERRALDDDLRQQAAHGLEAVRDSNLGARRLGPQLVREHPRRQVVALADRGREDQHPRRRHGAGHPSGASGRRRSAMSLTKGSAPAEQAEVTARGGRVAVTARDVVGSGHEQPCAADTPQGANGSAVIRGRHPQVPPPPEVEAVGHVLPVPAVVEAKRRADRALAILSEEQPTTLVHQPRQRAGERPHARPLGACALDHVGVVEKQPVEPLGKQRGATRRAISRRKPGAPTLAYHSPSPATTRAGRAEHAGTRTPTQSPSYERPANAHRPRHTHGRSSDAEGKNQGTSGAGRGGAPQNPSFEAQPIQQPFITSATPA